MAGQYSAIGSQAHNLMILEESYAFSMGFPTASTTLKAGQLVKLNADGSVSPIAATTDVVLGVVASAWQKVDNGTVRVVVPFSTVFDGAIADGVLAAADQVACSGVDANGLPKFKKAVAGDIVSGIVLIGAASGGGARVGLLRVPSLVAKA